MTILPSYRFTSFLLAAAVAIASLLLITTSANATKTGLFQLKRTWWGGTSPNGTPDPYISIYYHPRDKITGPNNSTYSSYVRVHSTSPAPKFAVPRAFIKDYLWTWHCVPGTCSPGYPASSQWYSYYNQAGRFQPNNSRFGGASGPTTIIFPTTMGNPSPPLNQGNPVTPTTTPCVGGGQVGCSYLIHDLPPGGTPLGGGRKAGEHVTFGDGNYDFSRAGSIMITPGKNRFGGTMQFFYGPNHWYFRSTTQFYPYISRAYGPQLNLRDPAANTAVGDVHYGGPFNIYRMTEYGNYRLTTGTPYSPGGFYQVIEPYFYTIAPFTTGMVTAWNFGGGTTTEFTLTGYDNRTPAGLNGVLSMVRPRLTHAYKIPFDVSEPITLNWTTASAWQMNFHFRGLPEPGSALMLTSSFVLLAGLYRRRRR